MNQEARETHQEVVVGIARWLQPLTHADIPPKAIELAKLFILDGIGVAVAALPEKIGKAVVRLVQHMGSGNATVIGAPTRVAPCDAAFANGALMHGLDFDDMSFGGHATTCVLPAVVAALEEARGSGRDLLTAYSVGMEVFGRLALVAPTDEMHELGWHPTGVFGLLASAAASAKALHLSERETADAISLVASFGCGLTRNFGSLAKPVHAGHAARSGLQAAVMAREGFGGIWTVLESEHGFGVAYLANKVNWGAFLSGLGNPWRITFRGPSIKQFPCCGANHRTIQALLNLRAAHSFDVENIEKIEVRIHPRTRVILFHERPADGYQAKFSLPFNVAVTLLAGKPEIATYSDGMVSNPSVLQLMDKVVVVADSDLEASDSVVRICLSNGQVLEQQEKVLHGSPDDPMSEDEVIAKFMDNTVPVLGRARADALCDAILSLDKDGERFWQALDGCRHVVQ
jgi:2-methylcitrate dehydratase PrpD